MNKSFLLPLMAGIVFLSLACTLSVTATAEQPQSHFQSLDFKLESLPGARFFEADIGGMHIVGADSGPLDGIPMVLINGYGTSFPYLSLFIRRLNARGFRVFAYNPPGQGRGAISSGVGTDERLFGINGMLPVAVAMVQYAFQSSNGKKVILAGHSLGGVQARLATIGLTDSHIFDSQYSGSSRQAMRRRVALVVPMFSPPLTELKSMLTAKGSHAHLLSTTLPAALGAYQWAQDRVQGISRFFSPKSSLVNYLIRNQNNGGLRGLFGAPSLDERSFQQTVEFIGPEHLRVSTQIASDLKRWTRSATVDTNEGVDLAEKWMQLQTSAVPLPTLYILGRQDSFVPVEIAKNEARLTRASYLTVNSGHFGAFFDRQIISDMIDRISSAYASANSCQAALGR